MENTEMLDSQQDAAETETMEVTETIDYGGEFEDPTAPAKPSESRTFSETENPSFLHENTEMVDSQQSPDDGLDRETVEKLLYRLEVGESHRAIAEETGVSRTDLTAISKFYRLWQSWNRVEMVDSQQSSENDGEKVAEMMRKIEELEAEKDRILTEKVARERDLKRLEENTAGLRKWVDRFKPELDERIQKLTEECATLTFQNKQLQDEAAGKPSPLLEAASDYQSAYARGREAGREEMKLESEAQGTGWLTSLLIPLTGITGIVAGALLVWVLK